MRGGCYSCAGSPPFSGAMLPSLRLTVNGRPSTGLLDTGCSRSIISSKLIAGTGELAPCKQRIVMMNGEMVETEFSYSCMLVVGGHVVEVDCLVSDIVRGFGILVGMDAVAKLDGVSVSGDGRRVVFGKCGLSSVAVAQESLCLSDKDFEAVFVDGAWKVSWRWADGGEVPRLSNWVSQYRMDPGIEEAFSEEIESWIAQGWLRTFEGEHDGLLPLMAVDQPNKGKVRPVLDYRELNEYVSSHTGNSVVCAEKLRNWRKFGRDVKVVDLKKAYLQVHVDESLWKYQVVRFKGQKYCLTRLGFGLNVAPKIMTSIVNKVLSMDDDVSAGTDSYIDDIVVNEHIVSSQRVIDLLRRYGLEAKPAVPLVGARVLGLRVDECNGRLVWRRDNVIEPPCTKMTKRQLFSMCGKLVGHFPVVSWLRPACSYLKRLANSGGWDSELSGRVVELAQELWNRVQDEDPVGGVWEVVRTTEGRVWCDASSLAIGVCLEVDGEIVEDASWLRRADDASHINLAELEAVLRGVNLAVSWGLEQVEVMTDSRTVFGWIKDLVTEERRIKTHGLGEALVRRRLALLRDIMSEYSLQLLPVFVRSAENKSDRLTRVPRRWLVADACAVAVEESARSDRRKRIAEVHEAVHCGVDKTLYLTKAVYPHDVPTRKEVQEVVRACQRCRSIDPAPVQWDPGELSVERNWTRLACDVTHYHRDKYLTLVDSGPSRFCVWKPLLNENISTVLDALLSVFCEMGPPKELLLDNSPTFKSDRLVRACGEWKVRVIYRAAYRPSGNGIVERSHRTIKRIAARTGKSPLTAVYWYNFLPLDVYNSGSAPHRQHFRRKWRNPLQRLEGVKTRTTDSGGYVEGEAVFVKPPGARCTTPWGRGIVTSVTEEGAVEVDGVHRHVADLRRVGLESEESSDSSGSSDEESSESVVAVEPRRSSRIRARPWRYSDADYEF